MYANSSQLESLIKQTYVIRITIPPVFNSYTATQPVLTNLAWEKVYSLMLFHVLSGDKSDHLLMWKNIELDCTPQDQTYVMQSHVLDIHMDSLLHQKYRTKTTK